MEFKKHLFLGKVIVLYGARQVGKTTLVAKVLLDYKAKKTLYLNCDEGDVQTKLNGADNSQSLRAIVGENEIVVIDEAQRIRNIGLKLKLMVDNFPQIQIIATGSSAFELSEEVSEPLTGRAYEFWLHPFSLVEMLKEEGNQNLTRNLENIMIFGSYPEVYDHKGISEKKTQVNLIADNYLYKDILKFNNLKSSQVVKNLLQALALQIGNEVSYTELAHLTGVTKETISRYIELLEKAFIIFRLNPLTRNLRKEIGKLRKIYFYDLGVRNSLINNFNPLNLRGDFGAMWENLMVSEIKKRANFIGKRQNLYFWRTYDQQEVDLILDEGGKFIAYEFKWNKNKPEKAPIAFREAYPSAEWNLVNKENYLKIL